MEAVSQSHCKTHRVIACKFTRKELCDKGFPKNFTNQGKKHIWVTSSVTKTEKNRRCFSLNITSILFHLLTIFKVSRNFKILNSGTAFYKNLFFFICIWPPCNYVAFEAEMFKVFATNTFSDGQGKKIAVQADLPKRFTACS